MLGLSFDKLKVRVVYATTGNIPGPNGLSVQARNFVYAGGGAAGGAMGVLPTSCNEQEQQQDHGERAQRKPI